MGVNDYLISPDRPNELLARLSTQVRKKRYQERLRENLQASMELAILDPLTRLHNRRYFPDASCEPAQRTVARGAAISLLVIDIDHFKRINDEHGHDCGDECCANAPSASASGARNRYRRAFRRRGIRDRDAGYGELCCRSRGRGASVWHREDTVPHPERREEHWISPSPSVVATAGDGFESGDRLFKMPMRRSMRPSARGAIRSSSRPERDTLAKGRGRDSVQLLEFGTARFVPLGSPRPSGPARVSQSAASPGSLPVGPAARAGKVASSTVRVPALFVSAPVVS